MTTTATKIEWKEFPENTTGSDDNVYAIKQHFSDTGRKFYACFFNNSRGEKIYFADAFQIHIAKMICQAHRDTGEYERYHRAMYKDIVLKLRQEA